MNTEKPLYRVLVTGTRGKSTATRYLAAAFRSIGISCSARITGTVPTVIEGGVSRYISRSCPGHIDEMKWWLDRIPTGTLAVVAENSAVSPEIQPIAARWIKPALIVWTTLLPDHFEHWGPSLSGARRALLAGIPCGSRVLLGMGASSDRKLFEQLLQKKCRVFIAPGGSSSLKEQFEDIARCSLDIMGLDGSMASFNEIPPDPHEFRVARTSSGSLIAWAFSSNDPDTAMSLFRTLGWKPEETAFLFNHRKDRPSRLASHLPIMKDLPWKSVSISGDNFFFPFGLTRMNMITPIEIALFAEGSGGKVFGCGNVRGLPFPVEVEAA